MNDVERTREFLSRQDYMIVTVLLADGSPWSVPVKIKAWHENEFEWDSVVTTEHSKAIDLHPNVSLLFYEPDGTTTKQFGFYAKATATKISETNASNRATYRATISTAWINDASFKKRQVAIV